MSPQEMAELCRQVIEHVYKGNPTALANLDPTVW